MINPINYGERLERRVKKLEEEMQKTEREYRKNFANVDNRTYDVLTSKIKNIYSEKVLRDAISRSFF
jgi:hypothetical protein